MLEYGRFKYLTILVVVLLSALYALPNVFPQDPSVQVTANRGAKVDVALKQRIEADLKKAGIVTKAVELQKGGELLVRLNNVDAQGKAADVIRPELGSNYVTALNLASTEIGRAHV